MVNNLLPYYSLNDGQFNYFITCNQFNSAVLTNDCIYNIDQLNKMIFNIFECSDKSYIADNEPDNF